VLRILQQSLLHGHLSYKVNARVIVSVSMKGNVLCHGASVLGECTVDWVQTIQVEKTKRGLASVGTVSRRFHVLLREMEGSRPF
jgi:hypothetical protein